MSTDHSSTAASIDITSHEIVYLLGLDDTAASSASRRALGVVKVDDASDPALFGLTTLLARGLAHLEETDVTVGGPAQHVAAALLEAEEWLRIAVVDLELTTIYVVAKAPRAAVALQAKALGIFCATPVDVSTNLDRLAVDVFTERTAGGVSEAFRCMAQRWTLERTHWSVGLMDVGGTLMVVDEAATASSTVPVDDAVAGVESLLRALHDRVQHD